MLEKSHVIVFEMIPEKVSRIFEQNNIKTSVDGIYDLTDVNEALKKVDKGGSKGKTLIKI